MGESPKIEFSRSRKGYDPLEVDAILNELQREIDDLKQRNRTLTETAEKRDAAIRQLSGHTQQSNMWLTEMFNKAAQVAEETELAAQSKAREIENNARLRAAQTEQAAQTKAEELMAKAQKEAELIRGTAGRDAEAARQALSRLSADVRAITELHEKAHDGVAARFSELGALLDKAALDLSAAPGMFAAGQTVQQPPIFPNTPLSPQPSGAGTAPASSNPYMEHAQKITAAGNKPPDPPTPEPSSFSYEDFIKEIQKEGRTPQYPPKRPQNEIIAVFGEDETQ